MSVYDDVVFEDKSGQVKCWGSDMRTYTQGSHVPIVDRCWNYSISMREGGFLNVEEGVLVSWTDAPRFTHNVFDKYGDRISDDITPVGELGDAYLFGKRE